MDRIFGDFLATIFGDTSAQEALDDGRQFTYKPQPDITTFELALCLYLLITQVSANRTLRDEQKTFDLLPPKAQRHFIVVRNESND